MLKNLTILVLTGALLPACIITDGSTSTDGGTGTGTGTGTDASAGTDSTGGTDASGTDSTDGTGSGSGDTTATPTTGEPTSSTGTTDQGTTGTTGQGSEYGMCGWVDAQMYYGCVDPDGATPGALDPMGAPIDCDPAAVEGADCSDVDGPVTNLGCCAANGDNFFCDMGKIVKVACGA